MSQYQVLEKLGEGAMGVVYRAIQKPLGREVALKIIRPELRMSDMFRARFVREARAAGAISHPNVVVILDAGESDGTPYYAMELVPGTTLLEARGRQPALILRRADEILLQLLEATAVLHDHGLVHRDIKPANVMLKPDGQVVLMDFSLVKDLDSAGTFLTSPGKLVGTPEYIAPEVFGGEPAVPSADVWSLGCLYHWLLAGRTPFLRDALPETIQAIIEARAPDLEVTCPSLDPPHREWLARMLHPAPAVRPAHARAALETFPGRKAPAVASVPTPGAAPARPERRLPPIIPTALIVLIVLLLAPLLGRAFRTAPPARPELGGDPGSAGRSPASSPTDPDQLVEDVRRAFFRLRVRSHLERLRSEAVPGLDRERLRQLGEEVSRKVRSALASVRFDEVCRRFLAARSDTTSGIVSSMALYEPVMELKHLDHSLRMLGAGLHRPLGDLLPIDHRPERSDPGWAGETLALAFGSGARELPGPSGRTLRLAAEDASPEAPPLLLWPAQIEARLFASADLSQLTSPKAMSYAIKGLENRRYYPGSHDSYVTGASIPIRPPRPDERVLLTVWIESMTAGHVLEVSFSADGTSWRDPVWIVGDRLEVEPGVRPHHHWVRFTGTVPPARLRLRYRDGGELGTSHLYWVHRVDIGYLVAP